MAVRITKAEKKWVDLYDYFVDPTTTDVRNYSKRSYEVLSKLNSGYGDIKNPSPAFVAEFPNRLKKLIQSDQFNSTIIIDLGSQHIEEYPDATKQIGSVFGEYALEADPTFSYDYRKQIAFANEAISLNKGKLDETTAKLVARTSLRSVGWSDCKGLYENFTAKHTRSKANKQIVAKHILDLVDERTYISPDRSEFSDRLPGYIIQKAHEFGDVDVKPATDKMLDLMLTRRKSSENELMSQYAFIQWAQEQGLVDTDVLMTKLKNKVDALTQEEVTYPHLNYPVTSATMAIHYIASHEPSYLKEKEPFLLGTLKSRDDDEDYSSHMEDQHQIFVALANDPLSEKWNPHATDDMKQAFKGQVVELLTHAVEEHAHEPAVQDVVLPLVEMTPGDHNRHNQIAKHLEDNIDIRKSEAVYTLITLASKGYIDNGTQILMRHRDHDAIRQHLEREERAKKAKKLGLSF